ncbi:MAG TPA: hypothetical protein PK992_18030, partial [Planctomycetaceae bacterium]|nr:hypothetical protein [Planctomycetaceae bacterium]
MNLLLKGAQHCRPVAKLWSLATVFGLAALCLSFALLPSFFAEDKPKEAIADAPLSPEEAARTMIVPEGFN